MEEIRQLSILVKRREGELIDLEGESLVVKKQLDDMMKMDHYIAGRMFHPIRYGVGKCGVGNVPNDLGFPHNLILVLYLFEVTGIFRGVTEEEVESNWTTFNEAIPSYWVGENAQLPEDLLIPSLEK